MSPQKKSVERRFERLLFAARWVMAPMYLGLALALVLLAVMFLREMAYYLPLVMEMKSEDAILMVLTLIDLTLAGNLLLIVLFSGYETFVSTFDFDVGADRPDWMGKVDFSGLKLKLIASIVAISGINLLKNFMSLDAAVMSSGREQQLFWMVTIHMVFIASGVMLAVMDKIVSGTPKH